MAEKRVSVRLAVVGGREVRAELEGVGKAGNRGFGRLGREMEAANARMAAFSRRVKVATAGDRLVSHWFLGYRGFGGLLLCHRLFGR
jgi:hypothetical protein